MIGNIHGGELIILAILAVVILGPERLPEYAAKLSQMVRGLREMAEGARKHLRDEMGPAFDDVDWKQLDPRQYDPRRIVREAFTTPTDTATPRSDKPNRIQAMQDARPSVDSTGSRANAEGPKKEAPVEQPPPVDMEAT